MPTSANRHPSRDGLLRDALGQLRQQRGVTIDAFALTLNDMVHAMCPHKMRDQPAIRSFSVVDAACTRAINAWRKRIDRWSVDPEDGGTEIPAWLEEPWVAALEEHGDEVTRIDLARRHGFLGVRRPQEGNTCACAFAALGAVSRETGEMMGSFTGLLDDGALDERDAAAAPEALKDIDNAIAALMGARELVKQRVLRPSLQVVGD
ncbi:hypothetical protein ACFQH5_15795 [Halomonas salifodinae]|uniref:Uncharacterized protein n=1 Tax=Halomonas salifodinae TaxID=438745 RepID=A0ABW2F447_9GAMM